MHLLARVLRLSAVLIFAVSVVHLALGLGADALLGARVPAELMAEPSLSSQNRFFGVAFSLYGAVLWLAAGDIERYRPLLQLTLALFFAAGCARAVAWALHGAPAPLVFGLMASEIVLPPLLWAWARRGVAGAG